MRLARMSESGHTSRSPAWASECPFLGVFCCKTIWQAVNRNNRIETTDAATHSCREGCGDESMLRDFSVDGVLQQYRG